MGEKENNIIRDEINKRKESKKIPNNQIYTSKEFAKLKNQ
jgi:hypothetical protein